MNININVFHFICYDYILSERFDRHLNEFALYGEGIYRYIGKLVASIVYGMKC